jgi:hypothetical protein
MIYNYNEETGKEVVIIDTPCQNCGKMVKVMLPFIGCIFCSDCSSVSHDYWTASTEPITDIRDKTKLQGDEL